MCGVAFFLGWFSGCIIKEFIHYFINRKVEPVEL